jgi:hypothetical protein
MPYLSQSRIVRNIAVAAVGGLGIAAGSSGVALAAYGPPSAAPPPPGGFSCILTSQTVGPAGKVIRVGLGGMTAGIIVPPGDFRAPAQITITEPFGSKACSGGAGIGDAGFSGFHALGGVGIHVQQHGRSHAAATGAARSSGFPEPITLRLNGSPQIHRGDVLVDWNGVKFVRAPHFFRHQSVISHVSTGTDHALLVLSRRGASGRAARAGAARAAGATASLQGEVLAAALSLPRRSHPGLGVLAGTRPRETSSGARVLGR